MYVRKTKKSGVVKRQKGGRVCKKFGCKHRLSIYNAEDYCHIHKREFME